MNNYLASGPVLLVDHDRDSFASWQDELVIDVIEVALFGPFFGLLKASSLNGLPGFRMTSNATCVGEFAQFALRVHIAIAEKINDGN